MSEADGSEAVNWQALTGEFYCVDAGSRGGFADVPLLHPWVHMYSVDADATVEPRPQNFASFRHFPLALHSSEGEIELFVAARPGMSSLLEFDEAAFTRHFGLMPGSETWKHALTQTHGQKTRAQTADNLFRSQGLERVDFFKLDTQGTELEILKGAREHLSAGRISVIKTEVSFLPVYRNQCTFSDIDQFLKEHGFVFVDCVFYPDGVHPHSSSKAVQGVHLEEQIRFSAGGDAVYALHPGSYTGSDRAGFTIRSAVLLNQMGYVSLAFDLLKDSAYPVDSAESLLRATAMTDNRTRLKQALKNHLSPWAYRKVRQLSRSLSSPK